MSTNQIESLIERYYQIQEHRKAIFLQAREAEKRKEDTTLLRKYGDRFYDMEKEIKKDIVPYLNEHPMWDWLNETRGIGVILAAALISTIDIYETKHASSVWKYAGLAPGQKRERGKKIDFNPFLKTTCWKIGESFVKLGGNSIYRLEYDKKKGYYRTKYPVPELIVDDNGEPILSKKGTKKYKYTDAHIHEMAKRKAVKLFLSHMWAEWRKREGLPVTKPYSHEYDV